MIWKRLMTLQFDDSTVHLTPLAFLALLVVLALAWHKQRSVSYVLCAFVFGVYLLFAVDKIFFPLNLGAVYADDLRAVRLSSLVNLVPFNFNFSELPSLVLIQIFQNVLLTVPFGFSISFLAHIPARRVLWLALAVGLGIELIQFVLSALLKIAIPLRVADVNDVLLNTLGVLIGYGGFRLFASLYQWVTRRLHIRHRGLSAYIYAVVSRS